MKFHRFLLTGLFIVLSQTLFSQPVRLPAESALSNPYVNCMTEDDDGYVWIGTRRGLNRFNGSAYKVYSQVDSLSLANDFVSSLCSDTGGRLWVGTSTGLCLLRDGVPDTEVNVPFGPVFGLASYDEDRLLVLSRTSLYIMDKHKLSYELIHEDETLIMAELLVTADGKVWISGFGEDLTVLQNHQRGDRHDPVAVCQFRLLVDIDLADLDVFSLFGDLIQDRTYHTAGAAPAGEEIKQNGLVGI